MSCPSALGLLGVQVRSGPDGPRGCNQPWFSWTLKFKKLLQYLSHRMFAARAWSIKCRRKEKLIAQFGRKLRDERFKPNKSMFGHYLPNKNGGATVAPKSKCRELKRAHYCSRGTNSLRLHRSATI